MKKDILIGFIISILTTLAGSYIYLELAMNYGFDKNWQLMRESGSEGMVLSLGAIPNLLLFFVYLKKQQEYKARGVTIGVILVAFAVMYYSYFH
jgi:hypothetical protein